MRRYLWITGLAAACLLHGAEISVVDEIIAKVNGDIITRSDYERGKLRLNADMILRLATALEVSTDDLLQPAGPRDSKITSRKVLRRLERIEALQPAQQTVLLRTIDTFLEGAAAQTARRA